MLGVMTKSNNYSRNDTLLTMPQVGGHADSQSYTERYMKGIDVHDFVESSGYNVSNLKKAIRAKYQEDELVKKAVGVQNNLSKAFNLMKAGLSTTTNEYASGTNYSATSGSLPIFPLWYDDEFVELSLRETLMLNILERRQMIGKFYIWDERTLATASMVSEDPNQSPSTHTLSKNSIEAKYCQIAGRVSGPSKAVLRTLSTVGFNRDALNDEIRAHTMAVQIKIEDQILNGSISTSSLEFDGIVTQISTLDTSLSASVSLTDLRDSKTDAELGSASANVGGGIINMGVTNYDTYDDIKELVQSFFRYENLGNTISFGVQVIIFEGVAVFKSKYLTRTSGSREFLWLDTRQIFLSILQDVTFKELGADNASDKFIVYWYGAVVVRAETHHSKITSIT